MRAIMRNISGYEAAAKVVAPLIEIALDRELFAEDLTPQHQFFIIVRASWVQSKEVNVSESKNSKPRRLLRRTARKWPPAGGSRWQAGVRALAPSQLQLFFSGTLISLIGRGCRAWRSRGWLPVDFSACCWGRLDSRARFLYFLFAPAGGHCG